MNRFVFAVLAACALYLSPATASACSPVIGPPTVMPPDNTERDWAIAYGVAGAIDATIIGLQLATVGDMFPDWAGHLELILGIAHQAMAMSLGIAVFMNGLTSCGPGPNLTYSLTGIGLLAAVGGWLITHAIWSYRDTDDAVQPFVAADAEGFQLGMMGAF